MKYLKQGIAILLVLAMTASAFTAMYLGTKNSDADAASAAELDGDNIQFTAADTREKLGTENNPLVVLEIVPYEGYAEFGYLVGGQEPVSLGELEAAAAADSTGAEAQFLAALKEKGYIEEAEGDEAPSEKLFADQIDGDSEFYWVADGSEVRSGYYERVADGTGNYKMVVTDADTKTVYNSVYGYNYVNDSEKSNFTSGLSAANSDYFVAFKYVDTVPAGTQAYKAVCGEYTVSEQWHYDWRYNWYRKYTYTFTNFEANYPDRYYHLIDSKYVFCGLYSSYYSCYESNNHNSYYIGAGTADEQDPKRIDYPVVFYPDSTGHYVVDGDVTIIPLSSMSYWSYMDTGIYRLTNVSTTINTAYFQQIAESDTDTTGFNWNWVWSEPDVKPDGIDDTETRTPDYNTNTIGHKIYSTMSAGTYKAVAASIRNTDRFLRESAGLKYKEIDGIQNLELLDTEDYFFVGWYEEGADTAYDFTAPIYGNKTLYAKWKENPNCNLRYLTNAEEDLVTNMPSNQLDLPVGSSVTVPDEVPLRNGYVFTGWTLSSGEAYNGVVSLTSDLDIKANWVTVVISSNTSDEVSGMPTELAQIDTQYPVRDGYVFAGWYLDSACTRVYDPTVTPTAGITLYADWYKTEYSTEESETVSNIPKTLKTVDTTIPVRIGYFFDGWFCDDAFTTEFNITTGDSDKTIYAKWTEVSDSETVFTIEFYSVGTVTVPESIENVIKNGQVKAEDGTTLAITVPENPSRTGYDFAGWYYDSACTKQFVFGQQIDTSMLYNSDGTDYLKLYANWKLTAVTEATVRFDTNCPAGASVSDITGFPSADLEHVQLNGTTYADGTSVAAPSDPSLSGYLFTGWYFDAACSKSYLMRSAIEQDYINSSGIMTLYAGWIDAATEYQISFNKNTPASVIAGNAVVLSAESLTVTVGSGVASANIPTASLQGNVDYKVEHYYIEVITATPTELNKEVNYDLIERANVIIISPQSHFTDSYDGKTAVKLWESYKNPAVFSGKTFSSSYYSSNRNNTFKDCDLSWSATKLIFEQTAVEEEKASLIYDMDAYTELISGTVKVTKTLPGDKGTVSLSHGGSNNNVYKLFIMMNQMNPLTFYNAFIRTGYITEGKYTCSADPVTTRDSNADTYWTTDTFLPYLALDEDDLEGTTVNSTAWERWNITSDLSKLYDESNENAIAEMNCFFYDGDLINLTGYFGESTSSHVSYNSKTTDLYLYYFPDTSDLDMASKAARTTAQAGYYLLHRDNTKDRGYDQDIKILELQPSNVFKSELYWFWYVRRFMSNYNGIVSVEQEATPEFIGKIADLNSEYDMIYVGSDKSGIQDYKRVTVTKSVTKTLIGEQWYDAGTYDEYYNYTQNITVKGANEQRYTAVGTINVDIEQNLRTVTKQWYNDKAKLTVPVTQTLSVRYIYNNDRWNYYDRNYYDRNNRYQTVAAGKLVELRDGQYVITGEKTETVAAGTANYDLTIAQNVWYPTYSEQTVSVGDKIVLNVGQNIKYQYETTVSEATGGYYSYSHIGASIEGNERLAGSLGDDDENTYYLSGNDITKAMMTGLLEFARAGYPIMFSKKLMYVDATTDAIMTDTSEVDTASYLYSLMETLRVADQDETNQYYSSFCYEGRVESDKLESALKATKCELNITSWPKLYEDGKSDEEAYINGIMRSNKTLTIEFNIEDASDSRYYLNLYIDTNADGRFDPGSELLDSLEIYAVNGSTRTYVSQDSVLKSGQTYSVSRDVSVYMGVIPWKLEIVQAGNELIRDNESGMSAIMPDDELSKEKIKVLQLVPNGATVYLPTTEEMAALEACTPKITIANAASRVNDSDVAGSYYESGALQSITNSTQRLVTLKFWLYTKDLKDFTIEIDRMSVTTFNNNTIHDNGTDKTPTKYISDHKYNMLILGFTDRYQDINNSVAQSAIEKFISEGKSVLFTHDTTSFDNTQPYYNYLGWGYYINKYFRDILGMDRFGVTLLYPPTGTSYSISEVLALGRDAAYASGTSQTISNISLSDATGSVGKYMAQGYTDTFLNLWRTGTNGNAVTKYAYKVNTGQLTEYPYRIDERISVAETHSQYYQLDLEAQDIVVWYTLDTDLSKSSDSFTNSRFDMRNNYYIYNRGNITYTGVGHSSGLTDSEVMLFVNTIVASFNAIAKDPKTSILNRDKITVADDAEYLYIDFDSSDTTMAIGEDIMGISSQYKRVYFSIQDSSILMNKKISMEFYQRSDEANGVKLMVNAGDAEVEGDDKEEYAYVAKDAAGKPLQLTDGGNALKIYRNTDETLVDLTAGERLYAGVKYYVDVPLNYVTGNKFEMVFRIVINYGKSSDMYKYGYTNISLLRRGLFNLD